MPCFKEAENLKNILPKINFILKNKDIEYEIIIIDTIETLDQTQTITKKNSCEYFKRSNSNNFGDAVRTGIKNAKGEYSIFMDADGSHEPEMIITLFKAIKNNDVVIASRYIKDGHTENKLILILMSKFLNKIYSTVLGIPCQDISNSFKIYKTSDLKKLNLKCKNFDIVEEILHKLYRSKKEFKIKEIPSTFRKREHGKTKRRLSLFIFSFIITLIKLKLNR